MSEEEKEGLSEIDTANLPEMVQSDRINKRVAISQETYKMLKIKTIEMGIDDDGKFNAEILGKAIDSLIEEKEQLKSELRSKK